MNFSPSTALVSGVRRFLLKLEWLQFDSGSIYGSWLPGDVEYPAITITTGGMRLIDAHGLNAVHMSLNVNIWERIDRAGTRSGGKSNPEVFVADQAAFIFNAINKWHIKEAPISLDDCHVLTTIRPEESRPIPERENNIERQLVTFAATVEQRRQHL